MEEEKKIDDADALVVAAVSPRKVRTEKEDFVKAPIESPPMSFKAGGGNKKRKEIQKTNNDKKVSHDYNIQRSSVMSSSSSNNSYTGRRTSSVAPSSTFQRSVIRSGLDGKKSAFEVKNWITCLLTLDGRDKFTKVSQMANEYTHRIYLPTIIKQRLIIILLTSELLLVPLFVNTARYCNTPHE
jgi:hypothetical protein